MFIEVCLTQMCVKQENDKDMNYDTNQVYKRTTDVVQILSVFVYFVLTKT